MRWEFAFGFVAASVSTGPVSCVVVDDDGGDDAGDTTMIGDGDGDPGDGDPGDGNGDPGDGDPGDGDGDPGDGDPSCLPGDPGVDFSHGALEFDATGWWDDNIDWTCTATEVDVSNGLHMLLDCPDAAMPIPIDVSATPSFVPPVFPGDTVHVRYLIDGGPWLFNRYLRVDVDGHGHLLTMIDGERPLPPFNDSFEPPFPIQLVSGLCTPTPEDCGNRERQAMAFEIDGEAVEMHDSSYRIVGNTEIWVAAAWQLHDFGCGDVARESYRVLIANTGWE